MVQNGVALQTKPFAWKLLDFCQPKFQREHYTLNQKKPKKLILSSQKVAIFYLFTILK